MAKEEDWAKDMGINEKAVERSASVDAAPGGRLTLPGIGETVKVTFLAEPRKIIAEKLPQGEAWFALVEHDGVEYDMPYSKTVAFGMKREMKRHEFSELKGRSFAIVGRKWEDAPVGYQKESGGDVKTYAVQYLGAAAATAAPKPESEEPEELDL